MKLTLKQSWRPRPLNSFLGFVDLKLGVTIVLLFAVFNKVAGVYGLIAVFTGGSFVQVSMYIYSVVTLVAFGWALKAISEEDPRRSLYFAHLFFADHVLSTAWTVFFAVVWWIYTPHDGRRQANSAAQEQLMQGSSGHQMTEAERTEAAMRIWNQEKGLAGTVIVIGWLAKLYFAALIYSYAIHLRKGSYRTLPRTNASVAHYAPLESSARQSQFPESVLGNDDDAIDDHYQMPLPTSSIMRPSGSSTPRGQHPNSTSITSFTDFINAPGRSRKVRSQVGSKISGKGMTEKSREFEDEVLFDSDELGHSRLGTTEESTSVSSRDEDSNSTGGRYTPSLTKERPRSGYVKNSIS